MFCEVLRLPQIKSGFPPALQSGETGRSADDGALHPKEPAARKSAGHYHWEKLGNAVTRNRIRRRLREIYRLHEEEFLLGRDLVVVARVRSAFVSYQTLERDFLKLAGKLGLLRPKKQP